MSTVARGSEASGPSAREESTSWLRAGASALMSAVAAAAYGFAALHPDTFSEQARLALAAYFLSQLPLTFVSAAFSAAMYLDGSPVRRVLVYLAVFGMAAFALCAVSAAYVHTAAFARHGKGLFDRPWINWLVENLGRSGRRQGSD